MYFGSLVIVFIVCLGTTMVLVPVVRRVSMWRGWTDEPDQRRKIHSTPIPNTGGLAIVGGVIAGLFVFALFQWLLPSSASYPIVLSSPVILFGAVIIAGVGFLDDMYDLHFRQKLLAQFGVTALVIAGGVRIGLLDDMLGGGPLAMAVSYAMTALWVVGTMNAVNFLDGMDGLAAGVVGIIMIGLAGVYLIGGRIADLVVSVALVGALLGFLRYNFYPAKIFMGDSGSLFLGYLLAVFALKGRAHDVPVLALVIPVVAMGLPILYTGTSIMRRLIDGKPLFSADQDHIHHRLAEKLSHRNTVLALYGVGLFFALGAMLMAAVRPRMAVTILLAGTAVVAVFLYSLGYMSQTKKRQTIHPPSNSGDGAAGNLAIAATSVHEKASVRDPRRSRANARPG